MKLYNYLLVVICIVNINLFSQNNFYNIDTVREIKMEFYDANWDYILDSLYVLGQKDRVLADVIIDGIIYLEDKRKPNSSIFALLNIEESTYIKVASLVPIPAKDIGSNPTIVDMISDITP